jgi:hypothetical protein
MFKIIFRQEAIDDLNPKQQYPNTNNLNSLKNNQIINLITAKLRLPKTPHSPFYIALQLAL